MAYRPSDDPTVPGAWCWPYSAVAGEAVEVFARGPAGSGRLEVVRIGAQRTTVHSAAVRLSPQEMPPDADAMGCDWPVVATFTVDPGWTTGYHEVVISVDGRADAVAFVVVRASTPDPARPLLVLSTNTWNAYNDVAGTNLYTGGVHASWMRPIAPGFLRKPPGDGSRVAVVGEPDPRMRRHVGHIREHELSAWSGSAGWPSWEGPFVAWAEANGIELDYAVNDDLERVPDLLDGRRLYLSVGHDEYWSWGMRDAVEGFVARGGNAAFLSGNVSYWQVRTEDDGRTMVGYKQHFEQDPIYSTADRSRLTSIWSDSLIGRPENEMTGLSFVRGGYHRIGRAVGAGAGGYTVDRPEHWLFADTGVGYGDLLGAGSTTVGYECDGCELRLVDGLPEPTGADGCPPGTVVLATAPSVAFTRTNAARPVPDDDLSEAEFNAWRVLGAHDAATARRVEHGNAVLAVRDSVAGRGTVVAVGCTDWIWGLAGDDPAITRMTRNLFERLTGLSGVLSRPC
jgi:hypothetical protein